MEQLPFDEPFIALEQTLKYCLWFRPLGCRQSRESGDAGQPRHTRCDRNTPDELAPGPMIGILHFQIPPRVAFQLDVWAYSQRCKSLDGFFSKSCSEKANRLSR